MGSHLVHLLPELASAPERRAGIHILRALAQPPAKLRVFIGQQFDLSPVSESLLRRSLIIGMAVHTLIDAIGLIIVPPAASQS